MQIQQQPQPGSTADNWLYHASIFNTKLASFCKKTFVDIFAMRNLHSKKRYLA
jgi:hypothetical protein